MRLEKREGAGNAGRWCTRSPGGRKKAHRYSHHRFTEIAPASPTQWFYGLLRDLLGEPGLFATVASWISGWSKPGWADQPPQDLTPASGCQDHTTSPYAAAPFVSSPPMTHGKPALPSRVVPDAAASIASTPRVRDDHDTPLKWGGTGIHIRVIFTSANQNIFYFRAGQTEIRRRE
jgi:hypothetical protein